MTLQAHKRTKGLSHSAAHDCTPAGPSAGARSCAAVWRVWHSLLYIVHVCSGNWPRSASPHGAVASLCAWGLACLLMASCAVERHVPEGAFYLKATKTATSDREATKDLYLSSYVLQQPNKRWFGFKVPLHIYALSKPGSSRPSSRLLRKLGEPPVLFDSLQMLRTCENMRQVVANAGYLHAEVAPVARREGRSLSLEYRVMPGRQYRIRQVRRTCDDAALEAVVCGADTARSLLRSGMPFDVNRLNEERGRISTLLRDMGYYQFNKDYVSYVADTVEGEPWVDLTVRVALQRDSEKDAPHPHTQYRIGRLRFLVDMSGGTAADSVEQDGATILSGEEKLRLRPSLLTANTPVRSGQLFSESGQRRTYSNFMRLGAVAVTHVSYVPREGTDTLDCDIRLQHARPFSVSFDLEGTNSAGDLGAAASASFSHRNLFRGSESLTLKLRGAYEAITGLDGYEGDNYTELGGELNLSFPNLLFPGVSRRYSSAHLGSSEISLQYNNQDRPEFQRRVLTAAWRYRWQGRGRRARHRLDLLEVNYVYMPWVSQRFRKQYLDSLGRENAILRYNYENLLIAKVGYAYSYNSLGNAVATTYGKDAYTLRLGVEAAGNLTGLATRLIDPHRDAQGRRTLCGIAYAQYVRADVDFARSLRIDRNNSLALHAAFGIGVPYGNSSQLPFEKRYFAGGANGVRGWSVRSLGPGAYDGADRQVNFLNQCGDIKLDLSAEYRTYLFWKLNGAAFIDAGNIWTIRDYEDQPGGQFRLGEFYKQIAVSYGLGLRLALDLFTLRLDAGMKAIDPAHRGELHWPLVHPRLSRDLAFHFAVGLPF